jgi:hypothetical protein
MEIRMKPFNRMLLFLLAALLFAACNPQPSPIPPVFSGNNPYAPQAGDGAMLRGDVRIDSASLALAESQPPQVTVNFAYFQPTPCFKLRVEVSQPDAQNQINLSTYAVTEKDRACALMALSTPLQASLNLGSFPKGHYSVWLNGNKVDEFNS